MARENVLIDDTLESLEPPTWDVHLSSSSVTLPVATIAWTSSLEEMESSVDFPAAVAEVGGGGVGEMVVGGN